MSHDIRIRSLVGLAAGVGITVIAAVALQAWRADAAGPDGSTFVPISPCRLLDTRPALC